MAARLGDVLYWIGCAMALVCAAVLAGMVGLGGVPKGPDAIAFAVFIGGPGLAAFLIGRAARYILAGR